MSRPEWDDYFMSLAYLVSTRATCDRKKVGAVLVKDRRIIATGYNGAPAGMPDCYDIGHELKQIDGRESCVRTLHAESNAIDFAGNESVGATVYTTAIPCYDCTKRIINAKIVRIVYGEYYASRNTDLVRECFTNASQQGRDMLSLEKWVGEFITPTHVPDDILRRTATIQRSRE